MQQTLGISGKRYEHSYAALAANGPLLRQPRAEKSARPASFWADFDATTAYFDCFWHCDGTTVLLVGPPPVNLILPLQEAKYRALPCGNVLSAQLHPSRSTMTTALSDVPRGTTHIEVSLPGNVLRLKVQPNEGADFANANVLVTMNKNNDLRWIELWADWHARLHGANAVILFDNGSTHYQQSDLEQCVLDVQGIDRVAVLEWPYKYGPVDPGVIRYPYWSNFLQMASLGVALRRFASRANAILNCDIDELVGRRDETAFERAKSSPDGVVTLRGRWVETARSEPPGSTDLHLAYRHTSRNPLLSVCANKWALDPARRWVDELDIHPGVHRIFGIPRSVGRRAPSLPFWHFKAINTNWKTRRSSKVALSGLRHRRLQELDQQAENYSAARQRALPDQGQDQ